MKYCNACDREIVFATASPRRRVLAHKIAYICDGGAEFCDGKMFRAVFVPADVDEVTLAGAEKTAAANAALKGGYAAARTDKPVLAFDTAVGFDDEVFGKPRDAADAVRMFRALCGRTHEVVTGVYLRYKDKIIEKIQKTHVTFGAFDENLVYNYVSSGAPFDKAGGYNVDDAELAPLIVRVDGDRDNVVGLPVELTEKLIEEYLVYGENGYRS